MENHPIGWVEKNTGISKETLRKWEERYGFPKPSRDRKGNRFYLMDQIALIARVGHLTNQGVPVSRAINAILTGDRGGNVPSVSGAFPEKALKAVSGSDAEALKESMLEELRLNGLASLVVDSLPGLNESVGGKWANGELSLYQEHLYTEVVQQVLRQAIPSVNSGLPLFALLATPPGESHALGILMVQSLCAVGEKRTISLGSQVPIADLSKAVEELNPFALGLSFSSSYPKRSIGKFLAELRDRIRPSTEIWIGGLGAQRASRLPSGIKRFRSISDFDGYLKETRSSLG